MILFFVELINIIRRAVREQSIKTVTKIIPFANDFNNDLFCLTFNHSLTMYVMEYVSGVLPKHVGRV